MALRLFVFWSIGLASQFAVRAPQPAAAEMFGQTGNSSRQEISPVNIATDGTLARRLSTYKLFRDPRRQIPTRGLFLSS